MRAVAARVVTIATLAIILFMPKIEPDAFGAPTVMSFAVAMVQSQALD